jgi:ribokinase
LENKCDLVVYGSLNMDFVAYVDHLPQPGETIGSKEFRMVAGGKAANQAVAASRLGARAAMVGCVGDDELGKKMKQQLTEDGVDDEAVSVKVGAATGTAMITVDENGENTIVTSLGANAYLSKEHVDASEEKLLSAKAVLLQLEMKQDVAEYIIEKAYQLKKKVVLNLAPVVPISKESLEKVDLLIVNETEAGQLTELTVTEANSAKKASDEINKLFGIQNIIVTLGENGAVLKTPNLVKQYVSPKIEAVDATAAGDCFTAAVTWLWIHNGDLGSAVKQAVEIAALSVTKHGAQTSLPTMSEYEAFRNRMEVSS